jgi:hypothetical protein
MAVGRGPSIHHGVFKQWPCGVIHLLSYRGSESIDYYEYGKISTIDSTRAIELVVLADRPIDRTNKREREPQEKEDN